MATSALGRPRPCGWGWVVLAPAAAASTSAAGVAEDSATSLASRMRFSESHQGRDSFPPLLSFVSATEKKCPLLAILHFLLLFCVFFKNVTEGPSGQRDRDKRTTQTPSFLKTFAPNLKPAHPRVRQDGEGSGIRNLELSQPLLWRQSRVGRVLGAHLQPGTGCLHIQSGTTKT